MPILLIFFYVSCKVNTNRSARQIKGDCDTNPYTRQDPSLPVVGIISEKILQFVRMIPDKWASTEQLAEFLMPLEITI